MTPSPPDSWSQLADLAQEFGIRVAYEALAWGRHVSTYDHAWHIVETADHPALGTCLDSFHILSRGSDPKGIEDIPGEKVFFLQLADAPLLAMDVLQWSRHHRCFPGQGGFDVAGLVRHVLRTGYAGPLSLEVFNDVFRQAEAARRPWTRTAPSWSCRRRWAWPACPPPSFPRASRSPSWSPPTPSRSRTYSAPWASPAPPATAASRSTCGSRATPVSSSTPVRQPSPTLGFVRAGTPADGTGLAAIGLESPDPAGAARRAEALLAPVLPRRRAPEDAPLDAVAAPDGTELFFCATGRPELPSWRADFENTENTENTVDSADITTDSGVTRIDHLALVQPWHHFDEATLFHRSVLGLSAQESVDVADPYGLLRSRAVTSADGDVRIALSVGAGPADDTVHAQHIAFATHDVVSAARRFREAGGLLLTMPANYYDDLAARFAFAEGELEAYRELGILYDRDAYGEFRHCYTRTVGRVFFELVQRDGGYRGYGAANAPVRLAAQHIARRLTGG